MSISDASTVTAADLNAMTTTQQGNVQADNAQLPLGFLLHLRFPTRVAGGFNVVPSRRAKSVFVAPCDVYVETVAVTTGDHTNPSTVTVEITGDGALVNWPIKVTGATGASPTLFSRLLYDNTKTKPSADFSTTSRAFRVFPKGSTITVQAASNSVATFTMLGVEVVFRQFFQRQSR
jgi:hypothetical protein